MKDNAAKKDELLKMVVDSKGNKKESSTKNKSENLAIHNRTLIDRREKRKFSYKNNQRRRGQVGRRRNEIMATYIHEIMLSILGSTLATLITLAFLKG